MVGDGTMPPEKTREYQIDNIGCMNLLWTKV